jgi:hypothetical protein
MERKTLKRQKPITVVLNTELQKNMFAAGLLAKGLSFKRKSLMSAQPNPTPLKDIDFSDPKSFNVSIT